VKGIYTNENGTKVCEKVEWCKHLLKSRNRKSATQMEKSAQFQSKQDDLFDIANTNDLDLMSIEKNRAFLISQLQKYWFGLLLDINQTMIKIQKTVDDQK